MTKGMREPKGSRRVRLKACSVNTGRRFKIGLATRAWEAFARDRRRLSPDRDHFRMTANDTRRRAAIFLST